MLRTLLVGLFALLLCACGDADRVTTSVPDAQASLDEPLPPQAVEIARTPVEVYPAATKVRLFVQDGRDAEGRGLYSDPDGRLLTRSERTAVERTIGAAHYGPGERLVAACFVPHHFLRYYDAEGRQVGELAICFCCAGIQAHPSVALSDGPAGAESSELTFDYDALKAAVEAMGLPTDIECD